MKNIWHLMSKFQSFPMVAGFVTYPVYNEKQQQQQTNKLCMKIESMSDNFIRIAFVSMELLSQCANFLMNLLLFNRKVIIWLMPVHSVFSLGLHTHQKLLGWWFVCSFGHHFNARIEFEQFICIYYARLSHLSGDHTLDLTCIEILYIVD